MKTIILFAMLSSVVCLSCTNKRQQSQPEATPDKELAIIGGGDTVTMIQVSDIKASKEQTVLEIDSTLDIDSPLSQSEIENYENRVRMQRLPNVSITYADAYKIRTQQSIYSPETKEIVFDVINMDGPTAEPEHYWLKQWKNGKWVDFPFIDNLVFSGVGYDLVKNDIVSKSIHMSAFKYPLKPGKYQVNFYVFANIYTYCNLTEENIHSIKDTEMDEAFVFKVLPSTSDSIRILFENHTNLDVQPIFLPSISTDELYMAHPFARSGWTGEADYMRSCACLKGGEAMLFTIPVSWDVNKITDKNYKKQFMTGKLLPGKYKIGLQLEIYMDTEFEVK